MAGNGWRYRISNGRDACLVNILEYSDDDTIVWIIRTDAI